MTKLASRAVALALALLAVPLPAAASEGDPPPIPPRRWTLGGTTLVAYNPLGLEERLRLGYQSRLGQSEELLFRDTFWFAGASARINPAYITVGPSLELQPLAVLNVKVGADVVSFFKSMGYFQSFASPAAQHDDDTFNRRGQEGAGYTTSGLHAAFEPVLQAQVGPIALVNHAAFEYWRLGTTGGDTTFYEGGLDTLIPADGFLFYDELTLVWLGPSGFTAGLQYRAVVPLYRASDFKAGDDPASVNNAHQRVGPLVAYTFYDHGYTGFDKPTVFVIAGWYLQHRYRTANRALPGVVLGFSFNSDWAIR